MHPTVLSKNHTKKLDQFTTIIKRQKHLVND